MSKLDESCYVRVETSKTIATAKVSSTHTTRGRRAMSSSQLGIARKNFTIPKEHKQKKAFSPEPSVGVSQTALDLSSPGSPPGRVAGQPSSFRPEHQISNVRTNKAIFILPISRSRLRLALPQRENTTTVATAKYSCWSPHDVIDFSSAALISGKVSY